MTTWLVTDNASSTIGGAGVFAGGMSLTLATGTGPLFPSPSSGQAFMLRIGTDASHETVTCTGRSGDVLTISALANNWLAGIPVELNFNATLFAALVQRTELGTAASHAAGDFDAAGAASGAVAAHVIAIDPHGDRAFASSAIETALESVSGAVSSVAGKTGAVTLTHSDLTDWSTATSGFLTSAPVASVAGRTGAVTLTHSDLTDWSTATSGFLTSAPVASVAGKTGAVTLTHSDLTDWSTATATLGGGGGAIALPFPFQPPPSPSLFDDEFTSSTLGSNWTITGTYISYDTTKIPSYLSALINNGGTFFAKTTNVPTGNFNVCLKLSGCLSGNDSGWYILFADSNNNAIRVELTYCSGKSFNGVFISEENSNSWSYQVNFTPLSSLGISPSQTLYLYIKYYNGTWTAYISTDCVTFYMAATVYKTLSITSFQIGYYNLYAVTCNVDFVRWNWSVLP